MKEKGFIYNGCVYDIRHVDWSEKTGRCDYVSCNGRLKDKTDSEKCQSSLLGHCCKHVINGTDFEKGKFKDASGYEGDIPDCLYDQSDDVVQCYHDVSKEIVKGANAFSISGEGKTVRITCEGSGKTEGGVDFISIVEKCWGNDCIGYNMGIISSFFSGCNSELFFVYRLLFQKYEEKRIMGKNVCCMPLLLDREIDIPKLDFAIKQAPQMYNSKKKDNDYSLAALYIYFFEKYHELHKVFYQNISRIGDLYMNNVDLLIDDISEKSEENEKNTSLKKAMILNEKIYQAHVMMEYILLIEEETFKPFLLYGEDYCKKLGDYMMEFSGADMQERKKIQCELVLQRRLLFRKFNVVNSHYKKFMGKLVEVIAENEKVDNGVGSIADYTTFSIVSSLVEYFVILYVFAQNMKEIYGQDHERFKIVRDEYMKWNELFESVHSHEKGVFFEQWWVIFNRLLQVDVRMAELDKMMS